MSAKHIVGGEITYKFKSRNGNKTTLSFTMKIYRDSLSALNGVGTPGAPLDDPASISIFLKKAGTLITTFSQRLQSTTHVNKNSLPCLITSNDVVVQEGTYAWDQDLPDLADTTESYVVVYQRCCRNYDIINIYNSNNVGATYTVEITQYALTNKNNSPDFKSFPPLLLCSGQPINFDHGAIDIEGDQLVYRFCQPIAGGGPGMGGGDKCNTPSPMPACYPPDGQISFKTPTFSYDIPLGEGPTIDPNTGLITGDAPAVGRYVVSVCVEEYRNGRLLSILHRDFQFNVFSCARVVEAMIKADTVIKATRTYVIQACGAKNVAISNLSLGRDHVNDFRFQINIPNDTIKYSTWEPTINFPDTGVYKGNLFLNPGTQCGDTINILFKVFPKAQTNFSYTYDTCVSGPVTFKDKSHSDGGAIKSWLWNFSDGSQSTVQNPIHLYRTPGIKNITLFTQDVKGCKSDTTANINYEPVPALIVIQPSTFRGCTPEKVFFNNLSFPIDSTYDIKWTFGDSGVSKAISPTHIYSTPGIYGVRLDITSPIGCKTSKSFPDWITVLQGTKADFTFTPTKVTSLNKTVNFIDKSAFASRWTWNFNLKGTSFFQNPVYTFQDTGLQKIRLITSNQYCNDTIVKYLDIEPVVSYFLPNAFTPNDDAVNDLYKGAGHLDGMLSFNMKIWNRWGELIFATTNALEGWNGRKNNSGEPAPPDVYICVVTYITPRGETKELRSYATLVR